MFDRLGNVSEGCIAVDSLRGLKNKISNSTSSITAKAHGYHQIVDFSREAEFVRNTTFLSSCARQKTSGQNVGRLSLFDLMS